MLQELQQLKDLVFQDGWDDSSRKEVQELEHRLQQAAAKEKLSDNPVIKEFLDYLTEQIDRSELLLKTDKTLTDRQRDELFTRIEICDRFTSMFNGKQRDAIELTIKNMLNVAKTR